MQALNIKVHSRFRLPSNRPIPTREQAARSQLRMGIVCAFLVGLVVVASGVMYALPLGKSTYTAELTEAGSVKVGDDIRIAGVPVGKVRSIELRTDRVRMTFTVNSDIVLGDQSTLDVRMLTIVGGHYVALTPSGTSPLGDKSIPADHVRLPYSLGQAFQDAAAPIREVDGQTLRENFAALQTSLDSSPDGLRRAGNAIDSLVDILDKQNQDVSRTLSIADEYLTAINTSKSLVGQLITKIGLIETIVIDKRAEVAEALRVTGEALSRLAVIGPAWSTTLKPMANKLAEVVPELQRLGERLGGAVDGVHDVLSRLQRLAVPADGVVVDQSSASVEANGLCIPVPGKAC